MAAQLIYSIGTPPSWCPYSPPEQFSSDYGNVYADENATLLPHYPLEPVFRALQLLAPTQTVSDMDLITCETTIEKLLRFVMHEGEEPYRFDVEIVGETAIFTRMGEESAKSASDYTGYRTSLPEKQTRGNTGENQLQSHYRIAKCTLDDVKCLLRFKGQACIPREDQAYSPGVHTQDESEDPGAFHSIPTFPGSGEHSPLEVRFGGEEIPQRMMAHIKTGNEFESDSIFRDMNTLRLWLSNTTTVVSTHGEQRLFRNVEVENFEIMNLHWELVHKFYIVKLASLIRMIIKTAKDISGGKCWVNVAGSLGLFVMAPTREMGLMSLPPDIKEVMFGIPDRWKPTSPGYVGPTNVESRTGHSRYSPPFMADSNFDLRGVHRFDQNSPI